MGKFKNKFREYQIAYARSPSGRLKERARKAYYEEREKQAIVYARQKAQIERERKVAKLRMRPIAYREAYRAAARLGRGVEPRRAFGRAERFEGKHRRRMPRPRRHKRIRRSSGYQSNSFFDNSMGGMDFGGY